MYATLTIAGAFLADILLLSIRVFNWFHFWSVPFLKHSFSDIVVSILVYTIFLSFCIMWLECRCEFHQSHKLEAQVNVFRNARSRCWRIIQLLGHTHQTLQLCTFLQAYWCSGKPIVSNFSVNWGSRTWKSIHTLEEPGVRSSVRIQILSSLWDMLVSTRRICWIARAILAFSSVISDVTWCRSFGPHDWISILACHSLGSVTLLY